MDGESAHELNHPAGPGPPSDVFWSTGGAAARRHPEQIGPYRISAVLGQGGMGIVYLACQDKPDRTVAVKVIRRGAEGRDLRRRFRREAEALLRLHHPGIAEVYDVGLFEDEDGAQPYLAMEHVQGLRLTEYARSHGLSVRQRMGLLTQICHAVHHAHRRGIVHRDLKPGNILVDGNGRCKILDFGLARITDSDLRVTTIHTEMGRLLGTIPYMSPEQVSGSTKGLDHRSDIYALGVIAYELLVERLPYDVAHCSIPEAIRVIHDIEPTRLSSLSPVLRGDVETIVCTALEKDPNRRYQSAADLAADIQRFLEDRPIRVKPAGTVAQFRKFARRNRALVAGVATAFIALSAGLTTTAWQAYRATVERDRAENEAATHREIAAFLHKMVTSATPAKAQGRNVTIRTFLDDAAAELADAFPDRPLVRAALHRTVGASYLAIGELDEAVRHVRLALQARSNELGPDDPSTIEAAGNLAYILKERGELEEAERVARDAIARAESVQGPLGEQTLVIKNTLGAILQASRKLVEAERLYRSVYQGYVHLQGDGHVDTLISMNNLGGLLMEIGPQNPEKFAEGGRLLRRCLALQREHFGDDHPKTISSASNLGQWHLANGDVPAARKVLTETHERAERVLGPAHYTTLNVVRALALAAVREGDMAQAEQFARKGFNDSLEARGIIDPLTIGTMGLLVNILIGRGSLDEARELAPRCYDAAVELYGADNWNTARAATLLVDLYEALGDKQQQEIWTQRLRGTPFDPNTKPTAPPAAP